MCANFFSFLSPHLITTCPIAQAKNLGNNLEYSLYLTPTTDFLEINWF